MVLSVVELPLQPPVPNDLFAKCWSSRRLCTVFFSLLIISVNNFLTSCLAGTVHARPLLALSLFITTFIFYSCSSPNVCAVSGLLVYIFKSLAFLLSWNFFGCVVFILWLLSLLIQIATGQGLSEEIRVIWGEFIDCFVFSDYGMIKGCNYKEFRKPGDASWHRDLLVLSASKHILT